MRSNASSTPIFKLPVEILTEIFCITCQLSFDESCQTPTPLSLGAICKSWREISWSTPMLWSMIYVKVSGTTPIDILHAWLLRAQQLPLTIKLRLDELCNNLDSFRAVLELLVTRAEYWQIFDCLLLPDECHDILDKKTFPLLTTVCLQPLEYGNALPPMFLSVPRLVDVDLSGYSFIGIDLPLGRLRRFMVYPLSLRQGLDFLRRSPALTECHFHIYGIHRDPRPFASDLEVFELSCRDGPAILLLDNLTLPKLRVFKLRACHISTASLYDTISSLILRSSCRLERLSIVDKSHGRVDHALTRCLELIPSVTHLALYIHDIDPFRREGHVTEELVSRLRPSQKGQCLLPKLQSLEYHGRVHCNGRVLVDMLSERWRHVFHLEGGGDMSRLLTAKVVGIGYIPDEVQAEIAILVSEGMQLEIH